MQFSILGYGDIIVPGEINMLASQMASYALYSELLLTTARVAKGGVYYCKLEKFTILFDQIPSSGLFGYFRLSIYNKTYTMTK